MKNEIAIKKENFKFSTTIKGKACEEIISNKTKDVFGCDYKRLQEDVLYSLFEDTDGVRYIVDSFTNKVLFFIDKKCKQRSMYSDDIKIKYEPFLVFGKDLIELKTISEYKNKHLYRTKKEVTLECSKNICYKFVYRTFLPENEEKISIKDIE